MAYGAELEGNVWAKAILDTTRVVKLKGTDDNESIIVVLHSGLLQAWITSGENKAAL